MIRYYIVSPQGGVGGILYLGGINMGTNGMSNVEAASLEFSKRMKKYPPEVQIAMGIVMVNTMKGCPWGITTSRNREFMSAYEKGLFQNSSYVSAHKIRRQPGIQNEDKYLVMVSMSKFIEILNKESPLGMMFTKEDFDSALERRNENINALQMFLSKGKVGMIGIFSLNDCNEVVVNGKRYPAFAVTLVDLVSYCQMYGYKFVFPKKDNNSFESLNPSVVLEKADIAYSLMPVAPSGNALFIRIGK